MVATVTHHKHSNLQDLFKTGIDAPKPANKCQNTGDDEDCNPGCPDTHCSTEFSTCVKPVGLPDLCSHRQRIARCAEEHDSNAEDPCIAGMACVESAVCGAYVVMCI